MPTTKFFGPLRHRRLPIGTLIATLALVTQLARSQSPDLPSRTQLSGRVVDQRGRPVDGAIVDLAGLELPKGSGYLGWVVATDSLGRFYFDSAQVDGWIRARSFGYLTFQTRTALKEPSASMTIRLRVDTAIANTCRHLCDLVYRRISLRQRSREQLRNRAHDPPGPPDVAAVYAAVIDSIYSIRGSSPKLIVVADSTQGFIRFCNHEGPCELPPHRSALDSNLLAGFHDVTYRRTSTRYSDPIPPIRSRIPIVYQSDADRDELFRLAAPLGSREYRPGDHDTEAYARAFRQLYPGAWGTLWLSRVGFNTAHTEALLQIWHRCGGNCATVEIIYLRKVRGAWRIWERMRAPMYNDEGWNVAPLRYIGEDAWREKWIQQRLDSARSARADSVRLSRSPRRVRGTITNGETGAPVAFARVAVHSAPDDRVTVVSADPDGRFVVRNPPIGGTMLEVRCPGSKYVRGQSRVVGDNRTIAAPGVYVRGGLDTTVSVTVATLQPCREALRIEREPEPPKVAIETRKLAPPPQGMIIGEVTELTSGRNIVAPVHVRGFRYTSTDASGRLQIWNVPPGSYKVDLICPAPNYLFGGINDSTVVEIGATTVAHVNLILDSSKCTGKPLLTRNVRLRGHWSIAFEDGFFRPCEDLKLPLPIEERGIGHNLSNLFTIDFAKGGDASIFAFPEIRRRENGGFLYYVDWTALLEGPGWFGHMGLAAYRLTVTHVNVARDAADDDCRQPLTK